MSQPRQGAIFSLREKIGFAKSLDSKTVCAFLALQDEKRTEGPDNDH
jgi:hypothetical protein